MHDAGHQATDHDNRDNCDDYVPRASKGGSHHRYGLAPACVDVVVGVARGAHVPRVALARARARPVVPFLALLDAVESCLLVEAPAPAAGPVVVLHRPVAVIGCLAAAACARHVLLNLNFVAQSVPVSWTVI